MSSYNPPSQDLPTFNSSVFSDNFTPDQVDAKIKTLQTEMDTQQLKTTQLSYDSGTTTSTFGGSTLDVNATLALPLHSDVDSSLTTIEGNVSTNSSNISTLQTKTTQLSYDGGNNNSTFGSQLVVQDTGDNTQGENDSAHQLRLITGTNNRTLVLGYDNSVDIGYINASKTGSTQPICLQTRGNNVGIGLTNPSELLDVNGITKCTNLKTANHTDVDGTLTTLNSKTTQLSYDSGTTTTSISKLDILTNPITATGVDTGEDTWDIRIPIQCSITKTIVNSATTTDIRLPKSIGNFSAGPSTGMVYLLNISRANADWNTADRPSYLGVLQLSTFATKKARLYEISGATNQINSIAVAEDGDDIDLQVQVGCSFNTSCKITLTQIR